jgi:hypothetical protein
MVADPVVSTMILPSRICPDLMRPLNLHSAQRQTPEQDCIYTYSYTHVQRIKGFTKS